jgi:hypothetical protein
VNSEKWFHDLFSRPAAGIGEQGEVGRGFCPERWPEATVSTEREDREAAAREHKAQSKTGYEITSSSILERIPWTD